MNGARHPDSSEDSPTQSQLLSASASSTTSSAKQNSQVYKQASQLFLTRRLQESLSTLEPLITVPTVDGSSQEHPNGDDTPVLAPIASFPSTLRIKVWNLYITLLSAIVDLGPEDGKAEIGQKEWKNLASKVREGEVWEMIVKVGYRGREGSVDSDVVYNLLVFTCF